MAAVSCLRVACGPTAVSRSSASNSRRADSSKSGTFKPLPLLVELQPAAAGPCPLAAAAGPTWQPAALPLLISPRHNTAYQRLPRHLQQTRHHDNHHQQQQVQQIQAGEEQLAGSAPLVLAMGPLGVQLNEPPPAARQQQEEQEPDDRDKDFFANVGDAIRTLREDYPLLFAKDLNYSIYREDLVFKDPNLTFRGLRNYRIIFWSLRFHGRLFLKAAHVRVLRIWQPEDTVIKLRWQINASPRVGQPGTFDGISVYRLDRRGRVYQHEVTDVQLRDPPITNPLLYGLNFILSPSPQVQQIPCPGSWFVEGEEDVLSDVLAAAPVLLPSRGQDLV